MKAEITQNKKAFEPIEVKITIESLDELRELCKRLQLSINYVNDGTGSYGNITYDTTSVLWKVLDDLYVKKFSK